MRFPVFNLKMYRVREGSCIHVPIYIDSSDSSDYSDYSDYSEDEPSTDYSEDEPSTVTFQTAITAVHGTVNQDAMEYVEGVVNSFPNATQTFQTAADNGDNGETVPITASPFAREARSEDAPQIWLGGHAGTNIMLALGIQAEGADVSLPKEANTSGVRCLPKEGYSCLQTAADNGDNGDNGQMVPIRATQVPFARETREEAPQAWTGRHGGTNIMPNEAIRIQAEGTYVSLPKEASTSGVRRSPKEGYSCLQAAADNGGNGETVPIRAIQVPFARSEEAPQVWAGRHGGTNITPNEALGIQVEGAYVSFPKEASTSRVRHSPKEGYSCLQTAADNGGNGETVPIRAIQVPFARETRSEEAPQVSTGGHECTNTMPNEALGIQAAGADVSLPKEASTSGVRRSSRKRNEVLYNEAILAGQLPRKAPAKPRQVGSSKKMRTPCLRMRASNYFPSDTDEDDESE